MNYNKRKIVGYIMALIGFVMILISALNYILGWNMQTSTYSIIGIVFVTIGIGTVKKSRGS